MKFGAYWEYQQGTGTYAYAAPAAGVLYLAGDRPVLQYAGARARSRSRCRPRSTPSTTSCNFR